ncbi:hypothetical protein MUN81_14775 [Hymenobacter sp. 5317J-9]|uniref:hypothetical protein n=1 Tax=Hymenobacter sp. 5317J-9 TaxID=2932250 RepID=UPI001FD6C455|nr:hypothetical protein [Hymenobacter sp. 5317J-9]UOQ96501.1 hypothetical protein MUN81_14775 [Hymenobacter sp. 5317J-9]
MSFHLLPFAAPSADAPGGPTLPVSPATQLRALEADAAMALDDWGDQYPPLPAPRPAVAPGAGSAGSGHSLFALTHLLPFWP